MTRISIAIAMVFVLAAVTSAEAQVYYPSQTYYSAYQATAYQPVISPSQSRTYFQPGISHYQPVVSTYFQAMPQPAASTVCQPVISSFPPSELLTPTPLIVTNDCDGCDRIKEIENRIAELKAKLNGGTSSSTLQKQVDFLETRAEKTTTVIELLRDNIKELTDAVIELEERMPPKPDEGEGEEEMTEEEIGEGAVKD